MITDLDIVDEKLIIAAEKLEKALEEELTKEYPNPKVLSLFERMQIITIKSHDKH